MSAKVLKFNPVLVYEDLPEGHTAEVIPFKTAKLPTNSWREPNHEISRKEFDLTDEEIALFSAKDIEAHLHHISPILYPELRKRFIKRWNYLNSMPKGIAAKETTQDKAPEPPKPEPKTINLPNRDPSEPMALEETLAALRSFPDEIIASMSKENAQKCMAWIGGPENDPKLFARFLKRFVELS